MLLININKKESVIYCSPQKAVSSEVGIHAGTSWTAMIYLDADNNLEEVGIEDLNELECGIGSSEDVTIIVLIDRIDGYDDSNGDWTGARLYRVNSDNTDELASTLLEDKGEINMGDPTVLTEFINYCFEYYPADHYWLNFWDHGGGIDGICWDDTADYDYLTIEEMQAAIEASEATYSEEIDIISHDACLMNMIEVAYELRNVANYFVASEETIPNEGFDYEDIISCLVTNSSMLSKQFAQEIVASYERFYTSTPETTLSAIDLADFANIIPFVNNFVRNLTRVISDNQISAISSARLEAREFDEPMFIDFIHFAERIKANNSLMSLYPDLENSTTSLISQLSARILSNYQHSDYNDCANGLSVFMPNNYELYNYYIFAYNSSSAHYSNIDWLADSEWEEFLCTFYKNYEFQSPFNPTVIELGTPTITMPIACYEEHVYSIAIPKDGIYYFSCSIFSGDADIYITDSPNKRIYGWSSLYNPEDGSEEEIRILIEAGNYLIFVNGYVDESTYILEVNEFSPLPMTLDIPVSGASGTADGDWAYHHVQTFNHFYEIILAAAGNYNFVLENDAEVSFDLVIMDSNYTTLKEVHSNKYGDTRTISIQINSTISLIICVKGNQGYGSFTLKTSKNSTLSPSPTTSPNTSSTKTGLVTGFTITIITIVFTSLGTIALTVRRKK